MKRRADLILKGGTLVNHDGVGQRDLAISQGRIVGLGDLAISPPPRPSTARACTSCPASSTPRCISASPAWSTRKTSRPAPCAAVMGGVTGVFEMPNTKPLTTTAATFDDKIAPRHRPHALRFRLLRRRHARERRRPRRAGAAAGLCRHQGVHGLLHRRRCWSSDDDGVAPHPARHLAAAPPSTPRTNTA